MMSIGNNTSLISRSLGNQQFQPNITFIEVIPSNEFGARKYNFITSVCAANSKHLRHDDGRCPFPLRVHDVRVLIPSQFNRNLWKSFQRFSVSLSR